MSKLTIDSIDTTDYVMFIRELAAMTGDVIGFVNMEAKLELGIDSTIHDYRTSLQRAHRKDRIIVTESSDQAYIDAAESDAAIIIRKLEGYTFNQKFDLALCDGRLFICYQTDDSIKVIRDDDATTYDAYKKLLSDLWTAADTNRSPQKQELNHTVNELRALLTQHNISDAHTHQQPSSSQQKIVDRLPELWRDCHYTKQAAIEEAFIKSFFELRQAQTAVQSGKNYINYSASSITALLTNYLRMNNLSVTLISPCFDNLPDLLRDGGIIATSIDEVLLHNPAYIYENLRTHVQSDVIFLVNPNNPTGFCLDESGDAGFRQLARYCHDYNKILIFDLCFMPFICRDPAFEHIDIYSLLDEYDISYITVEDTGKILPIMDTKAAILHVSPTLQTSFDRLHTNYILRQSPFTLRIVTEFIKDAIATDLTEAYKLFEDNRRELASVIARYELPLAIEFRKANLSVAWVKITEESITAAQIQTAASNVGVELLDGNNFYWDSTIRHTSHIRIAMARDRNEFRETIEKLGEVVAQLSHIETK